MHLRRTLGGLAAGAAQLVRRAGPQSALAHVPLGGETAISQRVQGERVDETAWVFVASLARRNAEPPASYWLVDYVAFSLELAQREAQLVVAGLRVSQHFWTSVGEVRQPSDEQLQAVRVLGSLASGFQELASQLSSGDDALPATLVWSAGVADAGCQSVAKFTAA